MGAVGALRRVKNAISVARAVMEHTTHTFLVGDQATQFAIGMGFKEESLSTNHSKKMWTDWRQKGCQPNYRKNVVPDPTTSCGPYKPRSVWTDSCEARASFANALNHDTIGMVVIDSKGRLSAGTSTNGMNHKIPGQVTHLVKLVANHVIQMKDSSTPPSSQILIAVDTQSFPCINHIFLKLYWYLRCSFCMVSVTLWFPCFVRMVLLEM